MKSSHKHTLQVHDGGKCPALHYSATYLRKRARRAFAHLISLRDKEMIDHTALMSLIVAVNRASQAYKKERGIDLLSEMLQDHISPSSPEEERIVARCAMDRHIESFAAQADKRLMLPFTDQDFSGRVHPLCEKWLSLAEGSEFIPHTMYAAMQSTIIYKRLHSGRIPKQVCDSLEIFEELAKKAGMTCLFNAHRLIRYNPMPPFPPPTPPARRATVPRTPLVA